MVGATEKPARSASAVAMYVESSAFPAPGKVLQAMEPSSLRQSSLGQGRV